MANVSEGGREEYEVGVNAPPAGLTVRQLTAWHEQTAFLKGYASGGTVASGLRFCKRDRRTIRGWVQDDYLGFRERYEVARNEFTDKLEDKAHELVMGLVPGQNPILLLALLNANLPQKYRPSGVVVDEVSRDLLVELRRLSRKSKPALSAGDDGLEPVERAGDGIDGMVVRSTGDVVEDRFRLYMREADRVLKMREKPGELDGDSTEEEPQ